MKEKPPYGPPPKRKRSRPPASERNHDEYIHDQINIRTAASRRKTMPVLVALIAAMFLVLVLIYMVRSVVAAFTPDIATSVVRIETMDEQRSIPGIIVRTELVHRAPRDGTFVSSINETERVMRGALVGQIQDLEAVGRISQNIDNVEEEIRRLHEMRLFSAVDATVHRIETNLNIAMNGSMPHFTTQNISEINNLHNRLTQLTANRTQLIISDSWEIAGEHGQQYEQLQQQMELNSTNMYAATGGIMSLILDGYEDEFTPDVIPAMSREQTSRLVDHTTLIPTREVEEGYPVFKLVGNTWYIVTHMPGYMMDEFTLHEDHTIFVQNAITGNYDPMIMRITHIEHFHTDSLVVFRSSRNIMSFLNQRSVSIRITDNISRGLKINNSAIVTNRFIRIPLTHVHGTNELFIQHHTGEYGQRQLPLDIYERTETHVYVLMETLPGIFIGETIAPVALTGDRYVITEFSIREAHGVFRATLGFADFTTVHLDGPISETGYTLLNPARNPSLRQFDTIVTDASRVSHGDILR